MSCYCNPLEGILTQEQINIHLAVKGKPMPHTDETMSVYEELALLYDSQGQAKLRDWFLVLAADAAVQSGWDDEAERLRGKLLQYNPHHLLKPFMSFAEAMHSSDIQSYITDLRRTYPPETAEQLLQKQRPNGSTPSFNNSSRSSNTGFPSATDALFDTKPEPEVYPLPGMTTAPYNPPQSMPSKPAPRVPKPPAQPAVSRPMPMPTPPKPAPAKRMETLASSPIAPAIMPASATNKKIPSKPPQDFFVSRWISSILSMIIGLVGIAMLVWALGKPFFPESWTNFQLAVRTSTTTE